MTNENDSDTPAPDSKYQPPRQPQVIPPAPPQGEVGPNPDNGGNNQQETAKELAREFRWVEVTSLIINGALAIIGVIALCIYNGQLNVMRGQLGEIIKQYPELQKSATAAADAAEISKDALHSVQRAFVTFPPNPQVTVFPAQNIVTLKMPIENAGATQAHGLKDRVSWVAPMMVLPDNYNFPDRGGKYGTQGVATGANVIPSKGKIYSQVVVVDNKVLNEFVQQNAGPWLGRVGVPPNPTRAIYFYGWATYRDIFKDTPTHLTEFCRYLTVLVIDGQNSQSEWGFCSQHNCTDEDCPDYKAKTHVP
jgi:hypothetical protein